MRLVGIDIGGTFTDLALYDSEDGRTQVHKVHSTPDDPGRALVTGVLELCERAGIEPASLDGVLHGTTVATNAVLEHHGARTGMVTTQGVRDVLHIGRHQRPEPYSVLLDIPWQTAPFVERQWRLTVPERLAPPTGEVIEPLDEEAVREAARELGAAGVEAIAVCFLFSYLDPAHELRAAEILREELPDCFVCTSADITPQFREFERFTTAAMNAFVGPGTGAYLERLEAALRREGVAAEILVMRSNGGVASVAEAAERPVTLMLSGPAAGRARRELGRRARRAAAPRDLRHGRHLGGHRDRDRGGRERGVGARHADRRPPAADADVRHSDDRGRRRLDRLPRRGRRLPRRPAQRGRRSRAGVLRPRRRGADDHRRASRPRPPRSGALPRRRDDAAARPGARGHRRARAAPRRRARGGRRGRPRPRERQHGADHPLDHRRARPRPARLQPRRLRRRGPAARGRARRGARDRRGRHPAASRASRPPRAC